MNIKEAKEEIQNAITAYFTKNKHGRYVIPMEKQRPIFLMGPPGIGKTAIMEQIAEELDVGLVSYSMTHHTRQSALGLPFIIKEEFDGEEYDISEYTMSEIIASVYHMIKQTGKREGILFLDEINCVSETLAPAMLQFLQYKIFGRHRVPEGWIVVTAGNPPEFNNSVREFDIATWDRLKRVDVEADFDVWKEFAYKYGVHASIVTYLENRKHDFYKIENTVNGKSFVTARGWSDLSDMIKLYEQNNIPVKERLIVQYLQNKKIAKDFAVYYDLYNKYKSDYQVDKILAGKAPDNIKSRASQAKFDEKLAVLGVLLDAITQELRNVYEKETVLKEILADLKSIRGELSHGSVVPADVIMKRYIERTKDIDIGKKAGTLSLAKEEVLREVVSEIEKMHKLIVIQQPESGNVAFTLLKGEYDKMLNNLKKESASAGDKLNNLFVFCEEVFKDGQEMLILVTELTINYYGANFISRYGCKKYFEHNKELLFHERQKEIIEQMEKLDWEA